MHRPDSKDSYVSHADEEEKLFIHPICEEDARRSSFSKFVDHPPSCLDEKNHVLKDNLLAIAVVVKQKTKGVLTAR